MYCLCSASGRTFAWLGWPRKMAVPSPVGDVKNSVPNWYLRAKYSDIQSDYILPRKNILLIGIYKSSYVIRIPPPKIHLPVVQVKNKSLAR